MRRVSALLLNAACAAAPLLGQVETGALTGTVTDPTGGVVSGATVTVKNVSTSASRSVTTGATGLFTVTNLQPADYQITVEASGFSTSQRTVKVDVGSRTGVDIQLSVGQAGTTMEVKETTTAVNVETQTLGAVLNTKLIAELPTLSRDPYALISTVGNLSPNTPDNRGVGYAINGQRAASTNVMLDGTANNDEFTASRGQTVPLDAVQEFSVLTSNFTAEYGRATGGVVNVATKSGTNKFHGTAYDFNRLSALASNDFNSNANGIEKQVFRRNQFGYSAGGPAIKNKLFFFSSTEFIKVRSMATSEVYIPTAQLIGLAAPTTQAFFQTYGALRSNLVTLGSFTKADFLDRGYNPCKGLAANSLCNAIPSNLPMLQRVAYGYPNDSGGGIPTDTFMTVARLDYNANSNTQMYLRYARYDQNDFAGTVSNSPYQGFDSPNTQLNNSVVYSLTKTFAPTLVSQTKVDFNRFNNQQPFSSQWANTPTLYLDSASAGTVILGNSVAFPGYLPYTPAAGIPFGGPQNFLQLYQDMSLIKGRHQVRFGGTYTYLRDNRTAGAYETAIEVLGNNTPRGFENFLAGNLYQFQAAVDPRGKYPCGATVTPDCTVTLPVGQPDFSRSNRYHDWALYVQDAYKVAPRVTLNLGVRWEVFGTQHNKHAEKDSNFYLGSGSTYFEQIANGSVQLAADSPIGKLWKTNYGNLGPRLGAAWDIFGDSSTSLRGGYGIGYERNFGNVTFNIIQNPPNYAVLSLIGEQDIPVIPVSVDNAGPLSGSTGSKSLGKVSLRAVDPNIATAYAHLFSAALEHRFSQNVAGAVEYSGSKGENQYGIENINGAGSANYYLGVPCTPGMSGDLGTCTARLRATQYSNINIRTNGGFSTYNAVTTRVDWTGKYGLQLRTTYTWSHAIDTLSDTFSSSPNQINLGWLDPFDPRHTLDKGDAYFDLRHRFTLGATWDIPYRNASRWTKQVAGGWTFAPIFQAYTGSPFSLYDCTNATTQCPYAFATKAVPINGTGPLVPTATPNNYQYMGNLSSYFDSSWYYPKMGASDFGPFPPNMIGRNRFRGPGFWNLDLGLHKSFTIVGHVRVQLRGEVYNIFNHPNLFVNTGDNDVSSVDYVSASYGGRRFLQVAAKIIF